MNFIKNNNITIARNRIFIKDKEIEIPIELKKKLEKNTINNSYITDNYIYLNGYEYKNGKFKKANIITRIIRELF